MAINQQMKEKVLRDFKKNFEGEPVVVRSPGRVNIIGEHTDYNNGFVLPAAIDKAIYVAVSPRNDEQIKLYSGEFDKTYDTALSELKPTEEGWPNYILGVADQLIKRGYAIKGFDLAIDGDVPIGSGLSSSAAVECATAFALNEVFKLNISKKDIVFIGQKAEHTFAGVMVGIMDQFASVFGKKDHVIKLDCQSLDYEYVPLKLEGYKILLLNTNVKHSLASSEYNTRRAQCEQGVAWVKEHHPQVNSLRDVTMEMLHKYVEPKDAVIYRRCKYVVEEKERLLTGCEDLKKGDLAALGKKMFQTHDGLSKEYEVSCKELDFLVDAVRNNPDVVGARMMGGGFGGCTINIVKEEAIDPLVKSLGESYEKNMGKELTAYIAQVEDGTSLLS
ncbi:MAG TPA: galactokinase [Flavisolibacter sp.]|nr:galactokinase [Flavisolibacter sp.]